MRYCRRSRFNIIYQPTRIGKQIRRNNKRPIKHKQLKRTSMQKQRRACVGSKNKAFNRFSVISGIILRRSFKTVKRGGSSIFVKRARYYAT